MANGMMESDQREFLPSSSSVSAQQQPRSVSPHSSCPERVLNVCVNYSHSKMDAAEQHPLPTPPSIPPDSSEQPSGLLHFQDGGPVGDPLAASPDLSHPAVVDAFTSDVRDEPPSPSALSSPLVPPVQSTDNPRQDSLLDFDRPHSEPPTAMQVDAPPPETGMVNGHKDYGEYTAADLFSGPAVESPEPTNEPTPPPSMQPASSAAVESTTSLPPPPSLFSGVEQAPPNVMATPSQPPPFSKSPRVPSVEQFPPPSAQTLSAPTPTADEKPKSTTPTPPSTTANTDTPMEDVHPSPTTTTTSTTKPVREAPTPSSDEPPAKRFKTEPSTPAPVYDTSKKLPASQHKFLHALLRQVKRNKDSAPFRDPVDPVKLNIPRYPEIIKRPMDLSTIEKKLNAGVYPVVQAFIDDFNLMVENCVKFNGPENPITKMGKNMQAMFERSMKTMPEEKVSRRTRATRANMQPPAPPRPAFVPPPLPPPPPPVVTATPVSAPAPKRKSPLSAPQPARRPSGAFVPPIRRESLNADGRPKREIKPPPERDIPMDKPRLQKKQQAELRFASIIVKELQKKVHEPYSYPFLLPVDAVALKIPDYYNIITQPMDIQTLDNKLKNHQYNSGDEFYADAKLIFKNCYRYNGANAPVSALAKQLEKVFDKKWAEKPEEPPEKPEKPSKRPASSSPPRVEEEDESEDDEIGAIQAQMAQMAERLTEISRKKQQRRQERSPTLKGKTSKPKKAGGAAAPQRSTSVSKPKKPKEAPVVVVTFEQKRELSERINFLSPSKLQGVLEIIKEAMPLDSVLPFDIVCNTLTIKAQEEIELDIDVLAPKTLHALYMYVVKDTKVPSASSHAKAAKASARPKKKREVLTADAQNKKIAELEATLGSYDKSMHLDTFDWLTDEGKPQAKAESESEEESDDDVSSDDSD
jgi:bromodomain-containing factor 1